MSVKGTYDHFYRYEEITKILKDYEQRFPQFTHLTSTARTPEGREQWLLEVTDRSTGSFEEKPALYVEGGLHAGEVTGSMAVMYFLDGLFCHLEGEEIRNILRTVTIYAMPRVSPDGSEFYLTHPDYVRSVNRLYPNDTLQDGLIPTDLDGDGVIRRMRVKTPLGIWKVSDKDPRLMVKRLPDETEGTFYNVYEEGLIRHYDALHIYPSPRPYGNDFNRNYPGGWQREDKQQGAGAYPLSNPETKGNATFLMEHPNVCLVIDMHTMGGQILYTPGFKARKEAEADDIKLYKSIGKVMQQENGYPLVNVHDEYMAPEEAVTYGGFDDFCHFVLGIPAFTIEIWNLDERAGIKNEFPPREKSEEEQEETALKYLQWIDRYNGGEGCKMWTKFEHPQLGEVEIGGVDYKYVVQNPPVRFLKEEIEKQSRALLRALKTLPHVRLEGAKAMREAEGVYRVEAVAVNDGYMPTYVFREGLHCPELKELTAELQRLDENGKTYPSKAEEAAIEGLDADESETTVRRLGQLGGRFNVGGVNTGLGAITFENASIPCQKKVSFLIRGNAGDKLRLTLSGGHGIRCTADITLE